MSNLPDGCKVEDIDNAWGTQFPVDERDPDAWENAIDPVLEAEERDA